MAKRADASICNKNSTCRVKKSRAERRARLEAERMTVDIEAYGLYQAVIMAQPFMKNALDALLNETDKYVFKHFLERAAADLVVQQNKEFEARHAS